RATAPPSRGVRRPGTQGLTCGRTTTARTAHRSGRGGGRVMTFTQSALDRTLWPPLSGGCHLSREPVAALREAGFTLGPYRRVMMPENGPALPSSYCVLGTAWRPS
ncbi:hypothetical protein ACWDVV_41830, partial [Streptomyces tendae]